jgi:hypothetical protein
VIIDDGVSPLSDVWVGVKGGIALGVLDIMKRWQLFLVCLSVSALSSANNSVVRTQPGAVPFSMTSANVPAMGFPVQTAPAPNNHHHRELPRATLADIGGGVVKEMKTTSSFVQQRAAKAGATDGWLMALAAFGLVFLQLRRKHKSLPQRRIVPYV